MHKPCLSNFYYKYQVELLGVYISKSNLGLEKDGSSILFTAAGDLAVLY
jgi:hypothetical protein